MYIMVKIPAGGESYARWQNSIDIWMEPSQYTISGLYFVLRIYYLLSYYEWRQNMQLNIYIFFFTGKMFYKLIQFFFFLPCNMGQKLTRTHFDHVIVAVFYISAAPQGKKGREPAAQYLVTGCVQKWKKTSTYGEEIQSNRYLAARCQWGIKRASQDFYLLSQKTFQQTPYNPLLNLFGGLEIITCYQSYC
jgi:hypothetical protein